MSPRPFRITDCISQYTFGGLGCALSHSFPALMACRILHAASSGVCEALPVQCVNDIYFLHERGKRLNYYTAALCLGSVGPLPAGYMLGAGYSWRLFFWVEFGIGVALLLGAILLVPETSYRREGRTLAISTDSSANPTQSAEPVKGTVTQTAIDQPGHASIGFPLTGTRSISAFKQSLTPWSPINHDANFFEIIFRSLIFFLVPPVLWVITSYGIFIGCAALAFNYTFPLLITSPPYSWSSSSSGLIAIAFIIGYCAMLPFSNCSDILAARLTRRNNGIREAEMRLGVMLPAMLIGPAGLVIYGCAAQFSLHWVLFFLGVAMVDWSALFFFTYTLAYAIDSLNADISEMLIAINVGKNAISFGMGYKLLTWVLETGYAKVIGGAFGGIMLGNNLILLLFMWRGKSVRRFTADYLEKMGMGKRGAERVVVI